MTSAWWIDLDLPPETIEGAAQVSFLTAAERARAGRFRYDRDRARWTASRSALRRILGEALGVRPEEIEFAAGTHGKPMLGGRLAGALEFNLSHSAGLALLAVSDEVEIGADVEEVSAMDDMEPVAERHFAPEECEALFSLPDAERLRGFYRLWTRKEAYIKAIGTGLGHALDRFAVSLDATDARILHLDGDRAAAARWTMVHLEPRFDARFVAAVAIARAGETVDAKRWTPRAFL